MKEYKAAVFVGRFQPFHNGHLEVLRNGLKIADQVIVLVGSYKAAPTTKNPWTFEERKQMIESCLSQSELSRVHIHGVRDYYNSDNFWVRDVQNKVSYYCDESDTVAILGAYKDSSSYYLKYFPQWEFIASKSALLDATDARNELFSTGKINTDMLPESVANFLHDWAYDKKTQFRAGPPDQLPYTEKMSKMAAEFTFNEEYKRRHQFRDEEIPYKPVFVTVDAVVVCSGHVLVVKRKFNPGQGLLALPGGFVRDSEKLKDAAIRELKEETGIKVDRLILENSIIDTQYFDDPRRSLRGRTITHAYYFRLKDGELPQVKGSDDAAKATWMPIMDIMNKEEEFFEDHSHIINYFINRGR